MDYRRRKIHCSHPKATEPKTTTAHPWPACRRHTLTWHWLGSLSVQIKRPQLVACGALIFYAHSAAEDQTAFNVALETRPLSARASCPAALGKFRADSSLADRINTFASSRRIFPLLKDNDPARGRQTNWDPAQCNL